MLEQFLADPNLRYDYVIYFRQRFACVNAIEVLITLELPM